jgi:hypothetical protein
MYDYIEIIKEYTTMKKQNESKRDCFVRIAEARTNKIIDMLRLLGNCSNTATYEYTKEDVKKIFTAIDEELKATKSKFDTVTTNNSKFKL